MISNHPEDGRGNNPCDPTSLITNNSKIFVCMGGKSSKHPKQKPAVSVISEADKAKVGHASFPTLADIAV
jgi:hypothetical protein